MKKLSENKKALILTVISSLGLFSLLIVLFYYQKYEFSLYREKKLPNLLKIESSAFQTNQAIPLTFSCNGENINPPLNFSNIPENTKSLALFFSNQDNSTNQNTYWKIWNITPGTVQINQNSIPKNSQQGRNYTGGIGYSGPCQTQTVKPYVFTLYALKEEFSKLEIDETDINNFIIDKAQLVGFL